MTDTIKIFNAKENNLKNINLEAIIEKPAGNYQLLVYAQDVAGNTSEIKTMLVRVVN